MSIIERGISFFVLSLFILPKAAHQMKVRDEHVPYRIGIFFCILIYALVGVLTPLVINFYILYGCYNSLMEGKAAEYAAHGTAVITIILYLFYFVFPDKPSRRP